MTSASGRFSREARRLQLVDRLVADPARREVHDPQERDLVARVVDRLEVGHEVAHLLAVVEAHAADDHVAHPVAAQHVLEGARLRVGAEDDRAVGGLRLVRGGEADDALDDRVRLVLGVLAGQHRDRDAVAEVAPEVLLAPRRVAGG